MPAAERVCAGVCGKLRSAGLVDGDMHGIAGGEPARHQAGATMRTSQRIGAPAASAARPAAPAPVGEGEVGDDVRHAAGMDDARGDRRDVAREATTARASSAMIAKERRVISAGSRM